MSLGKLGESVYSRSEVEEILARYKELCIRAADALASSHPYLEMAPEVVVELVKELRKAAE